MNQTSNSFGMHTLSYFALPTKESMSQLSLPYALSSSSISSNLIVLASIVFLIFAFTLIRRLFTSDLPPGTKRLPGPWGFPWLGRVHDVDPMKPWVKMKEFSDEYDGFFATTITGDVHLWLGRTDVAHDLFVKRAPIYSSRPEVPAVPGSDSQAQYLPLMAYDDSWKRQRKFDTTVLAHAHNNRYFDFIVLEAKRMLGRLALDPNDYYEICDNYCARITARLAYGNPSSATAISRNAGEFIPQISPGGPITNLMPPFGKLPEWLNPSVRDVRLRRENEARLFSNLMTGVLKEMAWGDVPQCYARTYFERKMREPEKLFDDHEASYTVGMLATVSIFTITGPLYSFLLAMVLHQDWQEKVREELDRVLGDRMVDLSDSPSLPMLRAAIKETVRWRPPVPLGVPRLAQADDVYNGYFIPKGTIVHAVDLAIARDESIYPDPEAFNPGRWIDPAYATYKEPLTEHPRLMGHHQFGCGLRMCPGVALTENELLVACASMVQNFTMKKKHDGFMEVPVDPDRMSPFLIGGALPFDFDLQVRNEHKAKVVANQWAETREVGDDYQLPHTREKIRSGKWIQVGDLAHGAGRY